ncbi:hypothetical protein A8B77_02460 [Erythrobacter sp. EhN03]|uniref:EAL domain-containing protein n=1 Tax=Qipengyuania flava TaxID=192812 RepID=UPI0007F392ED|nr:hypothetical protein A8B77_02460 [Erythrobacter sp. EhN03]
MRSASPSILLRRMPWENILLAALLIFSIGSAAQSGAFRDLDDGLRNFSFALRSSTASGQIHVVEMDGASVARIQRWPWPRSNYAGVVTALDAAGARSIIFDVDFSSASDPVEDAALARSLNKAAAQIILPTFAQSESFGSDRQIDALPIATLRQHASLASVSVIPDSDGVVRNMPLGTITADVPRPSLSAQAAGVAGKAGEHFPVDFAINPASIPRYSFIDIADGRFDTSAVRGKDILIGATAIEMGDRYATPRHGVLPGVIVQALAAETLLGGIPIFGGWEFPLLVGAMAAALIFAQKTYRRVVMVSGIGAVLLFVADIASYSLVNVEFRIVAGLLLILGSGTARAGLLLYRDLYRAQRIDQESGLPNRRALREADGSREHAQTIVAMVANFDAIKSVIGAEAIGSLMQSLAARMGDQDLIYRVDDRCLAWISEEGHETRLEKLTELRRELRRPLEVAGKRVDPAIVFGIAAAGATAEASLAASTALANDKVWHMHEAAEQDLLEQQVSLMGELANAIENHQLEVQYQPKLDLKTNRIASVEALVRWHHPTRGYLSPDSFIPLAEKSDHIADMTLFVLQRTLRDLSQWQAAGMEVKAAVNISARLLTSQVFFEAVRAALAESETSASHLIFEVTESATMADPSAALRALEGYRQMGIMISLDDYGTGQSTLTYLKTLPIGELKIDRSFVENAHEDSSDALLVRSTVHLAHALGLQVVAEGIETKECLDFLREVGCDLVQGYHVSRPLPAPDLLALCQRYTGVASLPQRSAA